MKNLVPDSFFLTAKGVITITIVIFLLDFKLQVPCSI